MSKLFEQNQITPLLLKMQWIGFLMISGGQKLINLLKLSEPFKRQPHKMVKHTQTIRRQKLTNCLSVFEHFVGLALKGLILEVRFGDGR